jgi:uncharacterized protein YdeI (YjbR/CyaY-like superfamily)
MPKPKEPRPELETIFFAHSDHWEAWLDEHHAAKPGLWVRFAKKASGIPTITYAEALEVALCYGWIDGLKKADSETHFVQKFVPRAKRSIWSKINRAKALALIKSGRMRPAGLAAIDAAKRDRRWHNAYDSPSNARVPKELHAALEKNPRAKAFFAGLDKVNRYSVVFRVQTATNPELRKKRVQQLVAMLAKREKIHPEFGKSST